MVAVAVAAAKAVAKHVKDALRTSPRAKASGVSVVVANDSVLTPQAATRRAALRRHRLALQAPRRLKRSTEPNVARTRSVGSVVANVVKAAAVVADAVSAVSVGHAPMKQPTPEFPRKSWTPSVRQGCLAVHHRQTLRL